MKPREARACERARTLVRTLEPHLSDPQAQTLMSWAQELQALSRSSLAPPEKVRRALVTSARSLANARVVSLVWEGAKDLAWEDRSWAVRLGLSGAAIAALTASSPGAGIAAFGTAIGVPLWMVLGAGGTFLGTMIDELARFVPSPAGRPRTSPEPVEEVETIDEAEWEILVDELSQKLPVLWGPPEASVVEEVIEEGEESLWVRFRELAEEGGGRVSSLTTAATGRLGRLVDRSRETLSKWRSRASVRVVAVDWSGDRDRAATLIWLAEVNDGELLRLENGRNREELTSHLTELAEQDDRLVVGLDFAFSFPVWFLSDQGVKDVGELWALVAERGERWLETCEPPFWGRSGTTLPDVPAAYRLTEEEVPTQAGIGPKSVFQIAGAGTVGTASIRGMPHLLELREAGFSIWPFDAAELPLVIEIYPRVLMGGVRKSDRHARREYLATRFPGLESEQLALAASSEHAFDAAASALVMDRHLEGILNLPEVGGLLALEGAIWFPDLEQVADHEAGTQPATPGPEDREGLARLLDAAAFAAERHRDQRRKDESASPYINHPLEVARLLAREGGVTDLELLQAVVLHDTLEDTETSAGELEEQFGTRVRRLVEEVTDDKSLLQPGSIAAGRKALESVVFEPPRKVFEDRSVPAVPIRLPTGVEYDRVVDHCASEIRNLVDRLRPHWEGEA